jgi:hypothetical protein
MFAVWPACNQDRDLADAPHWCSSVFGCRNACGLADRIEIGYHDAVMAAIWGAHAPRVLVSAARRNELDSIHHKRLTMHEFAGVL